MYLKAGALHDVGNFGNFLKKVVKKFFTHVVLKIKFFFQDFFGISKNGQKKCPKIKSQNIFLKIFRLSQHI